MAEAAGFKPALCYPLGYSNHLSRGQKFDFEKHVVREGGRGRGSLYTECTCRQNGRPNVPWCLKAEHNENFLARS